MFWLITSIVLFVVVFAFLGLQFDRDACDDISVTGWKVNAKQFGAILCLALCAFGCFTKVPANHVGVVYSPFGGTKETTLSEGFNVKTPFDKVHNISTEVQTVAIEGLTTQTMDAQYLTSILDIKYRVSESNAYLVFKQFKTLNNMSDNLIVPTTQRILELVTTKYNVIDILGEKRSTVYAELEAALYDEFAKYGVEFYSISIVDMDAGDDLEKAIADEAVAKKRVETAEENLKEAEVNAKQKAVDAQADQEAAKIRAETKKIEAQAEKEANELLNQSLTNEVLQKEWIQKWNGQMPSVYGGDDLGIMVNP